MTQTDLQSAIAHLKAGNYALGTDWEEAHEICQAHEGKAAFDWLHAVVHRIEGDDRNAGYWYKRARKERHPGTVEEELEMVRAAG